MEEKNRNRLLSLSIFGACFALASCSITKMAKVPAGYKSKVTCSEIFVAGRDADDVMATNFADISPAFDWVRLKVNTSEKTVEGRMLGFGRSKAVYREGVGCSLQGKNTLSIVNIPATKNIERQLYKVAINEDVQKATIDLFDDNALPNPILTRGVVVIQNGQLIAEYYKAGFDKNTRQQSWSTAKGFIQALIGIAVRDGHLSLEDKVSFAEWKGDDPRSEITIGHLLHMASGLEFSEAYANPNSHVDQMLFNQDDMGEYAASRKLVNTPGAVSQYSSGTTNILSKLLRNQLESHGVNYHGFPKNELFDKIGMSSAVFEVDAAGTFIGSSYIYATPRDFARFGQLYLQKGKWNDEQVLPIDWVEYTQQPAPGSHGKYGSHWSLNLNHSVYPGLPEDVLHLGGNDGQMIVVIPSKNAVIVRMGITRYPATLEDDLYPLIQKIYEAL